MKASRKRNLRWEHIDKSDTLLLSLVHQFELHNRIEGKSPKTISWYGENLLRFVTYLTGTKSEARLADLNMDTVRGYVLHLRSTPKYHKDPLTPEQKDLLSPSTIQGHVRTLRAFASWLEAEGYTECNVLARLKVPKAPNKVTVPLSDTEIASILDCYDPMTAMGCRNRAIIMTLLDTGVRCGELVHIRTEETHIAEGHIKVIGKGSKKDAERRLQGLLHSLEKGSYIKPTKLTVGEYLEQWLQGYVRSNTGPRTRERYAEIAHAHLIPALGSIPLTGLRPEHIQTYYAQALQSGRCDGNGALSARTVYHHHRVLYEALKHAVKHGLLVRNIAEAVDPPRPEHKEMTTLTPDTVSRFLAAIRATPYYVLFYTAIYTGLRRSELLGLRWPHTDLDLAALSVVETLHQLKTGEYVIRQPKSKRGRRLVALSPSLAILLREHRANHEANRRLLGRELQPADFVFSHPDGRPLRPDSVTKAFDRLARLAGLQGVRLHDLRHTHATLMLQQGIHPKIVQERLGHSTIAVTLDTYSHVLPGLQEAAARRFDEGLQATWVEMPAAVR